MSLVQFVLAVSLGGATRASALAQPGPLDVSGDINGAPFRIVVPATWNGTLLVFQRGWTDKADHPGEIDNRSPTITPPTPGIRDALLARGYALAGSARKSNGYSVEDGLDDVVALVSYFRDNVANPTRTILWGVSTGGNITLETAERNGGAFDGYLAINSGGAGSTRNIDHFLDFQLAYDIAFGMPASWGTPGDVRDDLDYETEVRPIVSAQAGDSASFGRWEFIRLVAGIPGSGLTPPPRYFPGTLLNLLFPLVTEFTAELERRAGGPVAQNLDHTYSLTPEERAYLVGLGVDPDPLLEAMNARRNIAAQQGPRNYLKNFSDFSGLIKHPVLTLHSHIDEVALVANEAAYRNTVAAAGRGDLLVQVFTGTIGHASFTTNQTLAAIQALDDWVRTGIVPSPSAFPVADGFLESFVPPAWPQSDATAGASPRTCPGCAAAATAAREPLGTVLESAGSQPFRGVEPLRYTLQEPAWVKLEVFSVDGRRVRTLVDRYETGGSHTAQFALNDGEGTPLHAGMYFIRLAAGRQVRSLRVVALDR